MPLFSPPRYPHAPPSHPSSCSHLKIFGDQYNSCSYTVCNLAINTNRVATQYAIWRSIQIVQLLSMQFGDQYKSCSYSVCKLAINTNRVATQYAIWRSIQIVQLLSMQLPTFPFLIITLTRISSGPYSEAPLSMYLSQCADRLPHTYKE